MNVVGELLHGAQRNLLLQAIEGRRSGVHDNQRPQDSREVVHEHLSVSGEHLSEHLLLRTLARRREKPR
eukprot:1345434-Lingulodinium_polyedra.AAC.1